MAASTNLHVSTGFLVTNALEINVINESETHELSCGSATVTHATDE